jgi:hypothetical protein
LKNRERERRGKGKRVKEGRERGGREKESFKLNTNTVKTLNER